MNTQETRSRVQFNHGDSPYQDYRRIFWLIVAALALVLAIGLPIAGFTIVNKFRIILFNQVMQDNDAISHWFESYLRESRKVHPDRQEWLEQVQTFLIQNRLPGEGYLCVVDANSNLRAAPGYNPQDGYLNMEDMLLVPFSDNQENFDPQRALSISELIEDPSLNSVSGQFDNRQGKKQLVDFRRIYIEGETWLIGVHQFESTVQERLKEVIPFVIILGTLLFLAIVIPFGFFTRALIRHHEQERFEYIHSIEKQSEELRATAEKLHLSNQHLNRLREQKNQLYARLSHDLRAPLNSILGVCNLISEGTYGETTPRQNKALHSVERNVDVLVKLIDGILQISKLESGQIQPQREFFDLPQLLHTIIENVRPLSDKKNLELRCDIPFFQKEIWSDRDKLYLIIQNLLSNAIQCTHEGYVELKVEENDQGDLALSVIDTGPGIKPQDQERIFHEFTRGEQAERGSGIGLGLTITKELTHLLGGHIELQSTVGMGSTFTVYFPQSRLQKVPMKTV